MVPPVSPGGQDANARTNAHTKAHTDARAQAHTDTRTNGLGTPNTPQNTLGGCVVGGGNGVYLGDERVSTAAGGVTFQIRKVLGGKIPVAQRDIAKRRALVCQDVACTSWKGRVMGKKSENLRSIPERLQTIMAELMWSTLW